MSLELIVRAFKIKVSNPTRKLILIKLADNANDKGECWPSYQHIADQCEAGRSTVIEHIKELEKQGFITIERRKGPKGNTSNMFTLNLYPGPELGLPQSRNQTTPVQDSDHPSPDFGPPPSPDSGPGISNSFESTNEPVNESKDMSPQQVETTKTKVPYSKILDLYHLTLPSHPQIKVLSEKRKAHIRQTWRNYLNSLEDWEEYFMIGVSKNDFLSGKSVPINGRKPWMADFDWLINQNNAIKVSEGKYNEQV